jgi:hypothetical protein
MRLGRSSVKTRVRAQDGRALWRTTILGAATQRATCNWCDMGVRLYVYTWDGPARDVYGQGGVFCGLHCWGQRYGFTEL